MIGRTVKWDGCKADVTVPFTCWTYSGQLGQFRLAQGKMHPFF